MAAKTNGLELRLQEMAGRIRELREIVGLSVEEMARRADVSVAEYQACEAGQVDLNFAFLYRCALALGVDVTDLISGVSPRLTSYAVTRRGAGQFIEQAHGMAYYNMAGLFRNRIADPLYVQCKYDREAEMRPIELTTHEGHECDIVISGCLRVQVGGHIELLHPGDVIYYDSAAPHGMMAAEGQDAEFYAIVLSPGAEAHSALHGTLPAPEPAEEPQPEPIPQPEQPAPAAAAATETPAPEELPSIHERFILPQEDAQGHLERLTFQNEDSFNFAFDVVDALARRKPDKLAMLHVDREHNERYFSFRDISRYSSRAANYFRSLGIRRGDRVMLVLRRHYQFWFAILGLHKLGAVAIPAACQLLAKDFEYRFHAGNVKAILCTAVGGVADEVDLAAAKCPNLATRILVGGSRDGWHDFDEELTLFSDEFVRPVNGPCGEDPMLMFFTSGTTGYPKLAMHCYKYPLGHYITAKYWHCVNPNGLHLTISDTGWAKALWGKLYGQWLCEAAVFVYDFDRFHADDILPMFAKYHITTFCAPPTMYRMLIKEDLSKYDLSSIQHATIAGEALNPEVFQQFRKATGLSVMEGFGQSESTVMLANLNGMIPKPGSMGKPVPIYDVQLLDTNGQPVKVGETGEIVVRTADGIPCGLFRGYADAESKTAEVWHDGYYHTGDTAWRDEDGYFWYVGRVDDLIKSSGYRIGPFEIESVLMELPYILECGVSAAPDPVRGQVVKASIVLTKGTEGTEELKKEIQNYVKHRTAPYKYPRIIVFRDALPKTTSGKIIRAQL